MSEDSELPNLKKLKSELVRADKLACLEFVVNAFEVGVMADCVRDAGQSNSNRWDAALTRIEPANDAFLRFREEMNLGESPLQPSASIFGTRVLVGTWANLSGDAVKLNTVLTDDVEEKAAALFKSLKEGNQCWEVYLSECMDALEASVRTEKRQGQARDIREAISSPMGVEAVRNKFSGMPGLRL